MFKKLSVTALVLNIISRKIISIQGTRYCSDPTYNGYTFLLNIRLILVRLGYGWIKYTLILTK